MIRTAGPGDLEAMASIEAKVSPAPWSKQQFMDSLQNQQCYVAEIGGGIAGFVIFSQLEDEAELFNIAVAPASQHRGIGGQLLDYFMQAVPTTVNSLFLEVRVSNVPAISLYLSRGFEQVGVRRNYYAGPVAREDALIMRCYTGLPFGAAE